MIHKYIILKLTARDSLLDRLSIEKKVSERTDTPFVGVCALRLEIHVGQCGCIGVRRRARERQSTAVTVGGGGGTDCSRNRNSGVIENARSWLSRAKG